MRLLGARGLAELREEIGHLELGERRLEHSVRDVAVEAGGDDADAALHAAWLAFEDVDVVRQLELAGRVPGQAQLRLRLVGRLGLGLRLGPGLLWLRRSRFG